MASPVADAQLVVCGDTGVARLSSRYARPSVVLFGQVSPTTALGTEAAAARTTRQ
jgi:ADP-heptose:LPS heptosyltransferase